MMTILKRRREEDDDDNEEEEERDQTGDASEQSRLSPTVRRWQLLITRAQLILEVRNREFALC